MRASLRVKAFMRLIMFFNKSHTLIVILLSVLTLILICDYYYLTHKAHNVLNVECNSTFEIKNNHAQLTMPVNGTLVIRADATGLIELTGFAMIGGSSYKLSRGLTFKYEQDNEGIYKLTNISEVIHAGDQVKNEFLNSNFFSFNTENSRNMSLVKINNAFIIGNLHSPVFMCVVKS